MFKPSFWGILCLGLIAEAVLAPGSTLAQTTKSSAPVEDADSTLAEIVITAERRTESVQKSALAIDALSLSALQQQGDVKDARDLASAAPYMHIESEGVYTDIYIHGVGGGVSNAYGSPAVAFSINGVFIDHGGAAATPLYDISRLELVKGPQGTLYGRNATAGALNVIPNKPQFSDESEVGIEYGNYHDIDVNGMFNTALSDTVALRAAFRSNRHDGYLSNGYDDDDNQAARVQLLWKASDALTVLGYVDYFHSGGRGQGPVPLYPGQTLAPAGPLVASVPAGQRYLNPSNPWQALPTSVLYPTLIAPPYPQLTPVTPVDGGIDHNQYIVNFQADWDLGFATATVIPAYVYTGDNSVLNQAGFRSEWFDRDDQFTLEARLASNKGPIEWVGGLYYYHSNIDYNLNVFIQNQGTFTINLPKLPDESKAAFGQATLPVTENLKITAGLRYTSENKSQTGQTIVSSPSGRFDWSAASCRAPSTFYPAIAGGAIERPRCGLPNVGSLSYTSTDYKVGIEYDFTPSNMAYFNASSGFKGGGFNPGAAPNTYPPEKLHDIDVGSKNRFFDDKLQLNIEAFYWKYKNQQIAAFGVINPSNFAYIVYPEDSHIYGASFDAAFVLTHDDRLSFTEQYQIGIIDSLFVAPIAAFGQTVGLNGAGATRSYTPRWSEHLDYAHTFHLSNNGAVVLDANSIYESKQYVSSLPGVDASVGEQGGYHKSNASLSYRSQSSKLTVGLYVNNIENKATVQTVQQSSRSNNQFAYLDRPRTYGIRAECKF